MMGTQTAPEQLFYDFCLEDHVPDDHLLRQIDPFLDLSDVRAELKPYYSAIGRPSVDPELMIRMLIIGYCLGIRSERRLCEEVHLNLAYRWFCGLGLEGHLKRILKLGRLRLRGPYGARDEFLLAATAQNLRKLAKLVWKPPDHGSAVPA